MQCPICGQELKKITKYGIEVDFCPDCRGVWFDKGEMKQLSDNFGKLIIPEPNLKDINIEKTYEKDFSCPRCHCKMFKVKMNGKGPIFDYCQEGCGYWFEDREFDEYVRNNYKKV